MKHVWFKKVISKTPPPVKQFAQRHFRVAYDKFLQRGMSPFDMRAASPVQVIDHRHNLLPQQVELPPDLDSRQRAELVREMSGFFARAGIEEERPLREAIEHFPSSLAGNPALGIKGSTDFNSLLCLHCFGYVTQPAVVVESGVFVGSSLWIFRKAAASAELHAFDVNLGKLRFRDPSIHYVEEDFSLHQVRAKGPQDFCYFDDHIDSAQRIIEAHERGFRTLVFDDCPNVANLGHYRYPSVPSALMLADPEVKDGQTFRWNWGDESLAYTFVESKTVKVARALIAFAEPFPDLRSHTGRNGGHDLVLVRLRESQL